MSSKVGRSFAEASKEIQDNLKRHISKLAEKEDSESSDDDVENRDQYVDKTLEQYGTRDEKLISSTRELLKFSLQSSSCLICIEQIKKTDSIWNCGTCYVSFHLKCAMMWAKDSLFHLRQQLEEDPTKTVEIKWSCPNCRSSYEPNQIPSSYFCYCLKERDPKFDPWLSPHSCGEKCGKLLVPTCRHKCNLLCHPGPCPPCPQTVLISCYCGKSTPTTKRCSASAWSCNTECGKLLSCGIHSCQDLCHPGSCSPCKKTSIRSCCCGKAKEPRPCSSPPWKCGTKCGKLLKCGFHSCDSICHTEGDCPSCPLSLVRHCPCGKSDYMLPCIEATPTCGDTCGKILACGSHYCAERCHRGNCPSCLQMMVKPCKCGSKKKEVQCTRQFTCDVKCKRIRDCGKHACNKKCCAGECPPCEQMCGKTLNCKNDKCLSRCHQGPCYPCNKLIQVSCNCGATKIKVPCGNEKKVKPPRCRTLCNAKSLCHHKEQVKHYCHPAGCPPCKQICDIKLPCNHNCRSTCHDNVEVRIEEKKRPAGPWEVRGPMYQTKKLPCPPCSTPVPTACLGLHDIADMPCYEAKPAPCGRKCGRQLDCQNHTCQRDCHRVRHAKDDISAGINCKKCDSPCIFPRPPGCQHPCNQGCHTGQCSPCAINLKLSCHCGLNNMFVKCSDMSKSTVEEKEQLLCCKDQCPKLLECGHRCNNMCHSGDCSPLSQCKKKVKMSCPCKRKKEDFRCFNVNKSSENPVSCDAECEAQRVSKSLNKKQDEPEEFEDLHSKREAEIFQKQQEGSKRKRRNRRQEVMEEEETSHGNKIFMLLSFVGVVTLGIILFNFYD